MKLNIANLDKVIELNELQEVTNPVLFTTGFYPNDDSFLSYKIFGLSGTLDRKTIFGYIDLKKHFLHPVIYKALTQMDRKFIKVIDGSAYFRIDENGQLVQDDENGENGLEWLYNNWKKLKFKSTDSSRRDIKLSLFNNMDLNEIFVTKWLVIPAFYRDLNAMKIDSGKPSVDVINKSYITILSLCQSSDNDFDFMGRITENKIQTELVNVYEILTKALAKKEGFIKHDLMGKTVDYSVRSVITAPKVDSNSYKNIEIPFGYLGVPLHEICVLFYPFFVYEIKNIVEDWYSENRDVLNTNKRVSIDVSDDFSQEKIKKMISLFISSQEHRLDELKVTAKTMDGKTSKMFVFIKVDDKLRHCTILDLLYITAAKIVEDKHIYMTRYPVNRHHSIVPLRIKILTTTSTKKSKVNNRYFENYPIVEDLLNHSVDNQFRDSVAVHCSLLAGIDGDFDGDTVSLRGVWTQEANEEAEKIINDPKFLLDENGYNIRTLKNEAIHTLYALTK